MARGSESASWKWADDTRHCDTCERKLRIADVALFYGLNERFIRCMECVNEKLERFVEKTRNEMGMGSPTQPGAATAR